MTEKTTASLADLEAQLEAQDQELEALTKLAEHLPAEAVFPKSFLAEIDELTEVRSEAAASLGVPLFAIRG